MSSAADDVIARAGRDIKLELRIKQLAELDRKLAKRVQREAQSSRADECADHVCFVLGAFVMTAAMIAFAGVIMHMIYEIVKHRF